MAQVAPMPMCPMVETCKGMMEKPPFRPGDGGSRDSVHSLRHIDCRLAICDTVARGHRVHPGGWRHAPDGQFHARGRRPAQTRRRLASNNRGRVVSRSGWRWCGGT